jgi:hypothetical protein
MSRFRSTLVAALAVGLLVSTAACGNDEDEEEPIPQTGNRPTTTTTASTTTSGMAPAGEGEGEGGMDGMEGQDGGAGDQTGTEGMIDATNGDPAAVPGDESALGQVVVNVMSSS